MPVELRPFQAELERRVYEAWNQGALNVMPVAATGSGSTGKAAILEGFQFLGFELDPQYTAIANLKKNNRHAA